MQLIFAALAALIVLGIAASRWRAAILFVPVLLVLEGVLRKWAFTSISPYIYFAKDFVLLGAYIGYLSQGKYRVKFNEPLISTLAGILTLWCLLLIFNPNLGSPIIGLFGAKNYLWYIPLIWIIPAVFQHSFQLKIAIRNYILLLIPVCVLAVAQFFAPMDSPLNVYVKEARTGVAAFGASGIVRVTGTFSYLTGYAIFLNFGLGVLLPWIALPMSGWQRILGLVAGGLMVGTTFMTGSRGVIYYYIIFLACYLPLSAGIQGLKIGPLIMRLVSLVVICAIAVAIWFRTAVEAMLGRMMNAGDSMGGRIFSPFTEPFERIFEGGLIGLGPGLTHQALPLIAKVIGVYPSNAGIPVEAEPARIMIEIGLIGFVFWFGLKFALIGALWKTFRTLKTPFLKQLALSAFLFHAINITGQLVFNHVFAIYYWYLAGFIGLLPAIERNDFAIRARQTGAHTAQRRAPKPAPQPWIPPAPILQPPVPPNRAS